jgi:hypothetical protein
MQLEYKQKKFFNKRSIFVISVSIIVALVVSGIVFFSFFINLFSLTDQPKEAQNTVNAYINALNGYNATAAWNLLSPSMQASYGTIKNFNESFVTQLKESGWHAQINTNVFEYGTIAEFSLISLQNSATVNANIGIMKSNSTVTNVRFTFDLKTYAYSHYQPSDWKINSKFTGF